MKKDKLLLMLLISAINIFCISNIIKSDTMVGYSDSKFLYSSNETDFLFFEISGGVQENFSIKIYNKENADMTYRVGSVDSNKTQDSFNNKTCLSENENQNFGKYISGDKSEKIISAGGSGVWDLTGQFPSYFSGIFEGCITYYPSTTANTTVNTLARRGNFINIKVNPVGIPFEIKVFPSNRINQNINNSNSGIIKIYNTNKKLISTTQVGTNQYGIGEFLSDIQPGTYYFVYKGQSHLASYLSGVIFSGENIILDFTTGNNLYSTQQLNLTQDDGYRYQTAGDLKNINGVYDYMINGNDIAIITTNGFFDSGIHVLDPRNLNGDGAINASDIAIIGINFEKTDIYYNNLFNW